MMAIPYKVCVILDTEFGEELAGLTPNMPVWIINAPKNKAVAQRLWKERQESHLTGITIFNGLQEASSEDRLLAELDTIDLHHGSHSSDPPYSILEAIGVSLNDKIKAKFQEYGFEQFQVDSEGFTAFRTVSPHSL